MPANRVAVMGASTAVFELVEHLRLANVDVPAMVLPRHTKRHGLARRAAALQLPLIECRQSINAPETIGVLQSLDCALFANWGHEERFGAAVLGAARHGVLNLHPGAIPGARGREPVFGAMLNGWREITQTVHRMSEAYDDGPIVSTRAVAVDADWYRDVVEERLRAGAPAFYADAIVKALRTISDSVPLGPSRYFPRLAPDDDTIDWNVSAELVVRRVRALSPFKPCRTWQTGRSEPILIWQAEVAETCDYIGRCGQVVAVSGDSLDVRASDGIVRLAKFEVADCDDASCAALAVGTLLVSMLEARIERLERAAG